MRCLVARSRPLLLAALFANQLASHSKADLLERSLDLSSAQDASQSIYPDWLPYAYTYREHLPAALAYWSDMIIAVDPNGSQPPDFYPRLRSWLTGRVAIVGLDPVLSDREQPDVVKRLITLSLETLQSSDAMEVDAIYASFAICLINDRCTDNEKEALLKIISDQSLFQLICARIISAISLYRENSFFQERLENIASRYFRYDAGGGYASDQLIQMRLLDVLLNSGSTRFFTDVQRSFLARSEAMGEIEREYLFSSRIWNQAGHFHFVNLSGMCAEVRDRVRNWVGVELYSVVGLVTRTDNGGVSDGRISIASIIVEPLPWSCVTSNN